MSANLKHKKIIIISFPERSPPFPLIFHPLKLMITQDVCLLSLQSCFCLLLLLFFLPESGQREAAMQTERQREMGIKNNETEREKYHNIIAQHGDFNSLWHDVVLWKQMRNKQHICTVLTTNAHTVT